MRYREILEEIENNDDMFAKPGDFSKNLKSSIQQETNPYRRLVVKVREISKQLLGVNARVSMSPSAVGGPIQKLGRATFLFGPALQGSPESLKLVRRMQKALTDLGLDTKVTGSGWLSVKVPPPFASLEENDVESDNKLFGNRPVTIHWTPESIADLHNKGQTVKVYGGPVSKPDVVDSIEQRHGHWMANTSNAPDASYHSRSSFELDPDNYLLLQVNPSAYMLINKPDWKQWRGNTLSENEESDDDLFGDNNLVSTLADKFEFPEEGALGYTMAGGGVGYGDGHQTEGLVVVDRETNQIAFIPDFTYFDDEPTQEDLEVLFYDDDSEYGTQRLPLTVQNIQKFLSLDEDTSDYCTEGAEAELEELPERPRKTTTKPDIRFDIPHQQAQDQPLAHIDPLDDLLKKAGLGSDTPSDDIRKARQADTLNKTAGLSTPDMSNMLSRMKDIELDNDLEPYQDAAPEMLPSVDVTTKNLPAVAGQALQASGVQTPEFHQVSNLPGNMADQIRQLGKSVFGSLTMTPTKRIHVIANLGGQGPNTTPEVQAVAGFLKKYGDDRGPGDVDFEQVMPGYRAQTHMYTAAGIRWMLVKDFAGQYIYCWPEEDSHDASPVLGHDKPEQGRLR